MFQNMASLYFERARDILRRHGLISPLKQSFLYLVRNGFKHKITYLYEIDLSSDIPEFIPKVEDYTLKVISKPSEVDELIAQGFDFGFYRTGYRDIESIKQTLSKATIVFCVFVDKELAHIGFVPMNKEAFSYIGGLPFKVDFQAGETSTGLFETNPKYRGKGIYVYAYSRAMQFLKEKGFSRLRFAIDKDNIASQKGLAKLGSRVYAEGRETTVFLVWRFWREKPPEGK